MKGQSYKLADDSEKRNGQIGKDLLYEAVSRQRALVVSGSSMKKGDSIKTRNSDKL